MAVALSNRLVVVFVASGAPPCLVWPRASKCEREHTHTHSQQQHNYRITTTRRTHTHTHTQHKPIQHKQQLTHTLARFLIVYLVLGRLHWNAGEVAVYLVDIRLATSMAAAATLIIQLDWAARRQISNRQYGSLPFWLNAPRNALIMGRNCGCFWNTSQTPQSHAHTHPNTHAHPQSGPPSLVLTALFCALRRWVRFSCFSHSFRGAPIA